MSQGDGGSEVPRPRRRQFGARVRIVVPGEPKVRWRLAANLSSGGMFIKDKAPPPEGTLVLVEFALPDGQPHCRVAGRVVHTRAGDHPDSPSGMGLKFVDYDANARKLVAAFREKAEHAQAQARARAQAKAAALAEREVAGRERESTPRRIERLRGVARQGTATGPVIGIDLGTTNSCAAIVENGTPQVIRSPEGYDTVPSVVFVESAERVFVGHKAAQRMLLAPDRAIYGSKRFIGRPFTSREVSTYGHFFRYGLVPDARGMAAARLGDRVIPLEAVAALILQHVQRMASAYFNSEVTRCVVTVPAYFGEAQRRAVVQAGQMVGLAVERVLSEPTAVAVAHGYGRGLKSHVLVYDLGGGTFDVSLVRIDGDVMEVLATDGDPFLGGSDFDDRLTEYLCMVIEQKHGMNVRGDAVAVQRVRSAAELAKQQLSAEPRAMVDLPYLAQTEAGPLSVQIEVTREQYERLTQDLVLRSIRIVDEMLHRTGIRAKQIDEIIMAGGQSRSPQIHRLVGERFGKKPSMRVHPDHAIAIGAALVAAAGEGQSQLALTDILPASIRMHTEESTSVLLPRGTRLPARTRFSVEASAGLRTEFQCALYRGESEVLEENELLGAVRLPSSLAEAVSGATAEVVVDVSADGLLTLAMRHPETLEIKSLQLSLRADGTATDVLDDLEITIED